MLHLKIINSYGITYIFHSKFTSKPLRITVYPTFSCNLACKHCNVYKNNIYKNELTLKEWEYVMQSLNKWPGFYHFIISGGECFLRKKITAYLLEISSNNYVVNLITNGSFLNKKLINEFEKKFNKYSTLNISLDGFNPETHDFLRGKKGLHKRITSAIDYITENEIKINTVIHTIITNKNLDEISDLLEWINNIDNNVSIQFYAYVPHNRNPNKYKNSKSDISNLWPTNPKKTTQVINQIISMKLKGYPILNSYKQLRLFKSYYQDPIKTCQSFQCGAYRNIHILPNGDVKICLHKQPIGNIKTHTLKQLWYSKQAKEMRNQIKKCNSTCKILNCNFSDNLKDNIKKFLLNYRLV